MILIDTSEMVSIASDHSAKCNRNFRALRKHKVESASLSQYESVVFVFRFLLNTKLFRTFVAFLD